MEHGYCTLLKISDTYGCLVFAKKDEFFVYSNQTLLNLVTNPSLSGLSFKMSDQIEFIDIINDSLFV